jgi:uncharacterized cupredoxin-like copper-binding protein
MARTAARGAWSAIALSMVAACAARDTVLREPPVGYIDDAPARVAAADWSKVETVTVILSNFRFTPKRVVFRQGVPYRLRLENTAGGAHTFTAPTFYKAIAAQKLVSGTGKITAPYVKDIEIAGKETKDLYFIPMRSGHYDLICSEPLHDMFGMSGEIIVE